MEEQEPLYVGVFEPIEARKEILNSVRLIISALRKNEILKMIREEKAARTADFKKSMNEIAALNNRLRQLMPKVPARAPVQRAEENPETEERPMPAAERKAKSRLDELEDELKGVEEKLRGIE